eukprot:TRINITY_DN4747_c0_g1_i8.p1 TRINITY_DN4747_c0_g1~~TRINITY_DN4747_c0_g1_i8.p1  ORF type:complete len:123 (+),score=14.39 TRINITY_DN4747_c0_g1_i8:415-783(+)
MEHAGITNCRHIPSLPSKEDRSFLERADLILLSGGDPVQGMKCLKSSNLDGIILQRAILVGISAGAMQLGTEILNDNGQSIPGLGIVSGVIAVHDEARWEKITKFIENSRGSRVLCKLRETF